MFKDLQDSDNLAYLFISHDLSVVEHISDEVGVMYLGNMVEYGSKREMFDNPLHPYTKALVSAVPVPDPDSKIKRIVLQGDIPSPANPPKGCKFHTRCSECMSACKLFQPKFTDLGGGHYVACHKYDQKVLDEMPFYDELVKLEDERNAEIDEMKAQKKQKKEDAANKIKELLKIKK